VTSLLIVASVTIIDRSQHLEHFRSGLGLDVLTIGMVNLPLRHLDAGPLKHVGNGLDGDVYDVDLAGETIVLFVCSGGICGF
jgi:hypothetical protein